MRAAAARPSDLDDDLPPRLACVQVPAGVPASGKTRPTTGVSAPRSDTEGETAELAVPIMAQLPAGQYPHLVELTVEHVL